MELLHCCQYTAELLKLKEHKPFYWFLFLICKCLGLVSGTLKFHKKEPKRDYFYSFSWAVGGIFQLEIYVFSSGKIIFNISLIYHGSIVLFSLQGHLFISQIGHISNVFGILSLYFWIIFPGASFCFFLDHLFKKHLSNYIHNI